MSANSSKGFESHHMVRGIKKYFHHFSADVTKFRFHQNIGSIKIQILGL